MHTFIYYIPTTASHLSSPPSPYLTTSPLPQDPLLLLPLQKWADLPGISTPHIYNGCVSRCS